MADYPIKELGDKTPLQVAVKPNIDLLAKQGRCGMFKSVPDDMPTGSEVANLAVLGYDVRKVYQGRGVLEAAAMGVDIKDGELVMRCNLLCIENEKIKNHSAGHITSTESKILIDRLNQVLADELKSFYPGVSYRHLFVLKDGNPKIDLTPPHDVPGRFWEDVLPRCVVPEAEETAKLLTELIIKSHVILKDHPINRSRIAKGIDPANSIWFWSSGLRPQMSTYQEMYKKTGAVISAVDLLHGIGVYAGFKIIKVDGATGLYDTNYEGKVDAALNAIKEVDLVYLHIEAADEAGHEGNVDLKIKCIEAIDQRVVRPIMDIVLSSSEQIAIAFLPDHPTPCKIRSHVHDAVPFIIYKTGYDADCVNIYDEESCINGSFGLLQGNEFIRSFLNN